MEMCSHGDRTLEAYSLSRVHIDWPGNQLIALRRVQRAGHRMAIVSSGTQCGGALLPQRCPLAKQLWEGMREVWPLKELHEISNTGPEWLLHNLDIASEQERLMMLMTFWRMWHVRNEVVHQKQPPPMEASRRFLCSYVDSLLLIKQNPATDPVKGKSVIVYDHMQSKKRGNSALKKKAENQKKWSNLPPGWLKLNVDGAWESPENRGGVAEAIACNQGMTLALQRTNLLILVESDCLVLTSMVQEEGVNRSSVAAIVNDIKKLCKQDRVCQVKHSHHRESATAFSAPAVPLARKEALCDSQVSSPAAPPPKLPGWLLEEGRDRANVPEWGFPREEQAGDTSVVAEDADLVETRSTPLAPSALTAGSCGRREEMAAAARTQGRARLSRHP
ncbi:hypothetical protein ACQ4PT_038318 [Festuca glaucescens]